MPLDMGRVNQTKTQVDASVGGGGDYAYVKIAEGDNNLRVVPGCPGPDGSVDGLFFVEACVAFNVGPKGVTVILPADKPADHPVMKWVNHLYELGDEASKKLADRSWPKTRYFMFAVDRNDEAAGYKLWNCNVSIFREILSLVAEPDFGDISHPTEGVDINVKMVPGANNFPDYTLIPKRNSTPVTTDPELWTKVTTLNLFELHRIGRVSDYDWVESMIAGREHKPAESSGGESASPAAGTAPAAPAAPPTPAPASTPTGTPVHIMDMVWYVAEGSTSAEKAGKDVQVMVNAGQDPMIIDKSQTLQWAKATAHGFIPVVAAPPPAPAAPVAPPPAPAAPPPAPAAPPPAPVAAAPPPAPAAPAAPPAMPVGGGDPANQMAELQAKMAALQAQAAGTTQSAVAADLSNKLG